MGFLISYESWNAKDKENIGLMALHLAKKYHPLLSSAKIAFPDKSSVISISYNKMNSYLADRPGNWSAALINKKQLLKSPIITTSTPYCRLNIRNNIGSIYLYVDNLNYLNDFCKDLSNCVGTGLGYVMNFNDSSSAMIYATNLRAITIDELGTYLGRPIMVEWDDHVISSSSLSRVRDIYTINLWPKYLVEKMNKKPQCKKFLDEIPSERKMEFGKSMELWRLEEGEIKTAKNIMKDYIFSPYVKQ